MSTGIENFSKDDFTLVHAHGKAVDYKAGDVIIQQGKRPDKLYWVIDGRVHIGLSSIAHRDAIDDLGAGALFGEIAYLLDAESATYAVAVDDSSILEVDGETFRELKVAYPGMAARFFKSISRSLAKRINTLAEA